MPDNTDDRKRAEEIVDDVNSIEREDFINAITTFASEVRQERWQPIETAPRDGTKVLLWWPHWASYAVTGWRCGTGWIAREVLSDGPEPTHWMPLPAPPAIRNEVGDLAEQRSSQATRDIKASTLTPEG